MIISKTFRKKSYIKQRTDLINILSLVKRHPERSRGIFSLMSIMPIDSKDSSASLGMTIKVKRMPKNYILFSISAAFSRVSSFLAKQNRNTLLSTVL